MKVLLNLCLLLSLISPVVLLTCKSCLTVKKTTCSKPDNKQCISDSSCKNYIFDSNVLSNAKVASKSCINPTRCDPGYYSLTTSGGGFIKMLVDCCTTYNCNKKPLQFSSQPTEPNGLECEGCHKYDRSTCEGVEMVKCLGDQTKCISMKINYSGIGVKGRTFITKGCATPLMCDQSKVKNNMDLGIAGVNSVIANCTDVILSTEASSLA